ncbi:centrosomal protein CEP57L1 isoform X4 [Anolis carolinensis]|uniref:centrosomal protein CEP57L1 isoform X4 n=1 Tax=Anolis carolinensis TaxID=28377 RepID=UPI000462DAC2|nr:PREDICTED: centrosomal protein CEP57L1 isoform X1 [Anolis carolinensis]|eukprot:XP_008119127.1 PREDICTED: centrosomal protein CEP57L1 isoform X1 [Anolis carolinensis]
MGVPPSLGNVQRSINIGLLQGEWGTGSSVMESFDSASKHSYIGSFLQPPVNIRSGLELKKKTIPKDIPAPNNQALVTALRTLQEKIHRLELERSQAEDDLNALSREAAQYKRAMQHESNEKDKTHGKVMQERKDVSIQLGAAQTRCSLLEKQLDYMRRMVVSAELEKKQVLEQQIQLQKEKDQDQVELCAKLDKLEILEKECWRLTSTQKTAEEKIKHLEQKLQEEQHQRKLIQDKAAQLQTGLEMNRILLSSISPQKDTKKKCKKKKVVKNNPDSPKTHGSQPSPQTGVLPFVAGKSASSSHSVVANVQSVLHMMKYRSPCVTSHYSEQAEKRVSRRAVLGRPSSCTTSSSATDSLSDLLLVMQDELGQMSFEHQELLKQIQETQDQDMREDLERELDCLVKHMEIKGEQISKLKKHQEHVFKMRRSAQKLKRKVANAASNSDELKGTKKTAVTLRLGARSSCSVNRNTSSLQLLKCAQKLQSVLKKDDIVWEP